MRKKPPTDPNQLAAFIVEQATDEVLTETLPKSEKNPAAMALGRLGGLKGGKARDKSLTTERKSEIARDAAKARWAKKNT